MITKTNNSSVKPSAFFKADENSEQHIISTLLRLTTPINPDLRPNDKLTIPTLSRIGLTLPAYPTEIRAPHKFSDNMAQSNKFEKIFANSKAVSDIRYELERNKKLSQRIISLEAKLRLYQINPKIRKMLEEAKNLLDTYGHLEEGYGRQETKLKGLEQEIVKAEELPKDLAKEVSKAREGLQNQLSDLTREESKKLREAREYYEDVLLYAFPGEKEIAAKEFKEESERLRERANSDRKQKITRYANRVIRIKRSADDKFSMDNEEVFELVGKIASTINSLDSLHSSIAELSAKFNFLLRKLERMFKETEEMRANRPRSARSRQTVVLFENDDSIEGNQVEQIVVNQTVADQTPVNQTNISSETLFLFRSASTKEGISSNEQIFLESLSSGEESNQNTVNHSEESND